MTLIEWSLLVIGVGVSVMAWKVVKISTILSRTTVLLQSLDAEVFRLAQEHNPKYGVCSSCGDRAIVQYVVAKDREQGPTDPELFYCQSCWWMSDSVQASDENKYYKDRMTEKDQLAARIGPG